VGKVGVWLDTPMVDLIQGEGALIKNFVGKYKILSDMELTSPKNPF